MPGGTEEGLPMSNPEQGAKEDFVIPQTNKTELPNRREIKPIAGGAPWLIQEGDSTITDPKLEKLIKQIERMPFERHTTDWLQQRWDRINEEFGEIEEANRYLDRLEERIDELQRTEEGRRREEGQQQVRSMARATTEAYRQPDFRRDDLIWQQRWLRQKLSLLESREVNFESYGNMAIYGPIMAHYSELLPDVRGEWEARRILHDYAFFFEQQGVFDDRGPIPSAASSITNEHIDVLLKLPGVGEALREYERRAHSDNPNENILVGRDIEVLRKQAAITEVARGQKQKGETDEEWAARGLASQRIAEHIWRITGRAALWTRLLEETFSGRVPDGDGVRGPCEIFLARVYNYERWARTHGAVEEMLPYADLFFYDFWSNLSEEFWHQHGVHKDPLTIRGESRVTRVLGSMENVNFAKLDMTSLSRGSYGAYIGDFIDANSTRSPLLNFLKNPSAGSLSEAARRFNHLSLGSKTTRIGGEQIIENIGQREVAEKLLRGLIWFRRNYSQRVFKEENWKSTNVQYAIRVIQSANLITAVQAERVLKDELGSAPVRRLRQEAAQIDWLGVLGKPVEAFIKALFGKSR